jgi:hypothetical protein
MTSKFEQLIEYVINDEEAKAKELFHDIVVEKSREIYENLMQEEELDEAEEAEEEDAEEAAEELDESEEELLDAVEAEEEGMHEGDESDAEYDDKAEEEGEELTHGMEKDHDEGENLEDRVVDLEDKLDELMAEFESLMGDDGIESDLGGEDGDEVEGDAMADDDTMAFDTDESMMENVSLAAAPKPTTTEPAGTNTKSTVAFNSGAAGMEGSPVKATGTEAKCRPAPGTSPVSSNKFQNAPATGSKTLSPATKPVTTQAAGVNTKTPFPKG